jgi:AcrR family transcriptional regulator/predicted DNA-binding transcriptional regulator AlpA
MDAKKFIRIQELSSQSGIPKSTIHYYLREGLLHPPQKTGRTMAYFDSSHLERLSLIKRLRKDFRMPIAFLKQEVERLEDIGKRSGENKELGNTAPEPNRSKKIEIIRAAIEVFTQKGYHNAKVNDITDQAGISTGTFYVHFKNKRDLFIEVVEEVFRQIVGDAARNIKGEKDLGKRLIIRGRTFFENHTRYAEILNQLRAEIASDEAWPQEKVNRMYKALTGPVIKEANEGIEKGQMRKEIDPELMAFALTGMIEVLSFRISLDHKYTIDDAIRFIGDLLINGAIPEHDRSKWQMANLM